MIDRSLNYGRKHVRRFLELAAPYEVVVDLGAGWGDDLALAREVAPKCETHGIDVAPEKLKALADKGHQTHSLDLEHDRLPWAVGSVDVVIANQLLEHVKEIFWLFHQVSRVLKEGGHVIIGVPNLAALHNVLMLLLGRQPAAMRVASAHVRGFTYQGLAEFLERTAPGLYAVRERRGANFYPFPALIANPLARVLPSRAWGTFVLLQKKSPYQGQFRHVARSAGFETNFR